MTPDALLFSVARHGLYPPTRALLEQPLIRETWKRFATALQGAGLLTLATDAVACGVLPVTGEQEEDLATRAENAALRRETADDCLDRAFEVLDANGIGTCVLHGAATAALDYAEPNLRFYESLHLLVRGAQRKEAIAILVRHGVVRAISALSWPRRARTQSHVSQNGVSVTLHTSIAPKGFGVAHDASAQLLSDAVDFTPRAVPLRALRKEERFIGTCLHARLDAAPMDLLAQRDVVQLALRDDVSVQRVERLTSAWRLEAVLAEAVRQAWETFQVPDVVPISALSRSYQPYRRDRRRLAARPIPELGR